MPNMMKGSACRYARRGAKEGGAPWLWAVVRPASRMPSSGIQEEYAVIAQGMRNGTLKEPPAEKPKELWIAKRFAVVKGDGYDSFCEHYNSKEMSSSAYSFGLCTLSDSKKVSVPKDMANGLTNDSPGPQARGRHRVAPRVAPRARPPTLLATPLGIPARLDPSTPG
eukprot:7027785-Prymnesium_polylepis.1